MQEFDLDIQDKKGSENVVADPLSRLKNERELIGDSIQKMFPDELLLAIEARILSFADYVNYIACRVLLQDVSSHKQKMFLHDAKVFLGKDSFYLADAQIESSGGVAR